MRAKAVLRPLVSHGLSPNRTCTFRYASGSPGTKAKRGNSIQPRRKRCTVEAERTGKTSRQRLLYRQAKSADEPIGSYAATSGALAVAHRRYEKRRARVVCGWGNTSSSRQRGGTSPRGHGPVGPFGYARRTLPLGERRLQVLQARRPRQAAWY